MRELLIGLGIAMMLVLAPMTSSASTASGTVQVETVADKAPAKCDKDGKPCKKGKDCSPDNCKDEPEPDDSEGSEE